MRATIGGMKHLIRFAALAIIGLPFVTSAATAAELQAQAQVLLQQVAALQAQLGAQAGTTGSGSAAPVVISSAGCPQLGVTLRVGSTGSDVSRLQQFLARDPSVYPEGTVSGYFGALTQAAVQRWQVKYNIVSSGTPETTGYGQVGPRTAAAMSLQCSTTVGGGGAVNTPAPTVGGFIQVSPISGNAPLSVNITATVNTVNSCGTAVYTLDFGDGTIPQNIPVGQNACAQFAQTYTHLYLYGGMYVVKLSSGTHQTSATVVVSGAGAPAAQTLPPETITANPTSGQVPLAVVFSGLLTGADAGWCQNGCSDTLDFGDGSSALVALPQASNGTRSFSVSHTYTGTGTYTAKLYQGQAGTNAPLVGNPITISASVNPATFSYGPFAVSPNVGGNPLAVSTQFDIPTSCTGYDLSWGDGTADVIQNDGGSSCAQSPIVKTFAHTYAGAGSYTLTLKRGASLQKQDSVSLVISN
jgi:PKD repeat protein